MTDKINNGTLHEMEYQEPIKKIQEALVVCSSAITLGERNEGAPPGSFDSDQKHLWLSRLGSCSYMREWGPGMLLNNPQCPGWPPPTTE